MLSPRHAQSHDAAVPHDFFWGGRGPHAAVSRPHWLQPRGREGWGRVGQDDSDRSITPVALWLYFKEGALARSAFGAGLKNVQRGSLFVTIIHHTTTARPAQGDRSIPHPLLHSPESERTSCWRQSLARHRLGSLLLLVSYVHGRGQERPGTPEQNTGRFWPRRREAICLAASMQRGQASWFVARI